MLTIASRLRHVLLPTLVLALALPALAAAGGPAHHDTGINVGVDGNFCGSGKEIHYETRYTNTVWVIESGGEEATLKVTFSYRAVLTAANGLAVIDSGAGSEILPITKGTEDSEHTHVITNNGLRSKLRLPNGGVVTRDAGTVVYALTFDADDNVIAYEFISMHGPHPDYETGVWCTAALSALGY